MRGSSTSSQSRVFQASAAVFNAEKFGPAPNAGFHLPRSTIDKVVRAQGRGLSRLARPPCRVETLERVFSGVQMVIAFGLSEDLSRTCVGYTWAVSREPAHNVGTQRRRSGKTSLGTLLH